MISHLLTLFTCDGKKLIKLTWKNIKCSSKHNSVEHTGTMKIVLKKVRRTNDIFRAAEKLIARSDN